MSASSDRRHEPPDGRQAGLGGAALLRGVPRLGQAEPEPQLDRLRDHQVPLHPHGGARPARPQRPAQQAGRVLLTTAEDVRGNE